MATRRCVPPRNPFTSTSARQPDGGFLAVHKQDFNAHTSGQGYRHCADQINMNPPLDGPLNAPDVQETLELIGLVIGGGSFVTIGDGYARGDYNIGDTGISNLNEAFVAAFADNHLEDGGTILLLSGKPNKSGGSYTLTSTVSVPSGISIWGEPGGVIINGRMVEAPMFRITTADQEKRTVLGAENVSEIRSAYSAQETKLWNLTLVSNLNRESGKTMQTVPMIQVEDGSVLKLDNVTCFGSITATTTAADLAAVGGRASPASSNSTVIDINGCLFDGFSCGVIFSSDGGANDYLTIKDCRIRYFGTNASNEYKYAINMLRCNATISGNWMLGMNDGTYGANGCINIKTDAVDDSDVRINVINNSGDIGSSATAAQKVNFINTNSTTNTIEGINSMSNSWGSGNPKNFMVVLGDGTNSIGDITGPNALNIAIDRLALVGENEAVQSTLLLREGNYNLTRTVTVPVVNIIGGYASPYSGNRSRILVNVANTATDHYGRNTTVLGGRIENVIFNQTGTPARYNSVTIADSSWRRSIIRNVNFEMPVVFQNSTGQQSALSGDDIGLMEIDGCKFSLFDTITYPNDLAVYVDTDSTQVRFSNCLWSGWGYALHAAEEVTTTTTNFRMSLDNCRFNPWGASPSDSGPRIDNLLDDNSIANYKQRYIWINLEDKGDLDITNCQFLGVDTLNDYYDLIGSALLGTDATNKIAAWIELKGRRVFVDNCVIEGPDQEYTDGQGTVLPALYMLPTYQTTIANSSIRGGIPLLMSPQSISGSSSLDGYSNLLEDTDLNIVIENNLIHTYTRDPGWWSPTAMQISTQSTDQLYLYNPLTGAPDEIVYPLTCIIRNNTIGHKKRLEYTSSSDRRRIPSSLQSGNFKGLLFDKTCGIYLPNWGLVFEGNTIYGDSTGNDNDYACCAIWTNHDGTANLADAKWPEHCFFKGNRIMMRSRETLDNVAELSVCLWMHSDHAIMDGNYLMYINDGVTYSAGRAGWVIFYIDYRDTDTIATHLITNNVFNRLGDVPDYGIRWEYYPSSVQEIKGLFVNNLFSHNFTTDGSGAGDDLQRFVENVPEGIIFERVDPRNLEMPTGTVSTTFDWEETKLREY